MLLEPEVYGLTGVVPKRMNPAVLTSSPDTDWDLDTGAGGR